MATSSDKDDRAETESTESASESGDTQASEAEEHASEKHADVNEDGAQEADAGKREGDKTADPDDKGSAFAKSGKATGAARSPRTSGKRGAKSARGKAPAAAVQAAPVRRQGGSLGKSVVLFVIIVGGLAGAFALFNNGDGGGRAAPNWKTGQQVDVELTLIKSDKEDLACASSEELAGKHCAFEAQNKRWSKSDVSDDKKLLKPYTTTNGAELLAAGVWSEPALSGTLPATRFSVKCKYTVEGKLKKPGIRWSPDKPWYENPGEWYSGFVSGCTLIP